MRLDRHLSGAGLSRSEAKAAIRRGRVTVDGRVESDPASHVPEEGAVALDGAPIRAPGHAHLMMHKPEGVVTAARDNRARTVFDLIPPDMMAAGLGAVGRLDRDTTGLLLFTTDGALTHRLISPRYETEKVYRARVSGGTLDASHVRAMAEGIRLKDFTARPARLEIVAPDEGELTITEGKYHQVKRMFGALGLTVVALHRLSVAGVALDEHLAPGDVRALTDAESTRLYAAVQLKEQP